MTASSPVMTVIKPGMQSLFVDNGRRLQQQLGLTQSGPMDDYAYRWANRLLDNPRNSAALEICMGFFSARIMDDCQLVITGADFSARLNDRPLKNWHTFTAKSGDILSFNGPTLQGLRAYIAIRGGFECAKTFGSCCAVAREALGGQNQGQPLQQKEVLHKNPALKLPMQRSTPPSLQPNYDNHQLLTCRFIPAQQWSSFSVDARKLFVEQQYSISDKSNRMGYRLKGEALATTASGIISEGITLGAIQVPADGQPIVLMRDRQTIVCYPKLGQVIINDIEKIAQAMPGQQLQFVAVDIDEAYRLHLQRERFFKHA